MAVHITISNSRELFLFPADRIVYVEGSGDYSDITMADGKKRTLTCQLGKIEDMMRMQLKHEGKHLVRIGKSLIVNMNCIAYINPVKKQLVLSDSSRFEFHLSASREALTALKNHLEESIAN